MLEDELLLMVGFENNTVFIETLHATRQLNAAGEVDRDRHSLSASVVEESVLEVLI